MFSGRTVSSLLVPAQTFDVIVTSVPPYGGLYFSPQSALDIFSFSLASSSLRMTCLDLVFFIIAGARASWSAVISEFMVCVKTTAFGPHVVQILFSVSFALSFRNSSHSRAWPLRSSCGSPTPLPLLLLLRRRRRRIFKFLLLRVVHLEHSSLIFSSARF